MSKPTLIALSLLSSVALADTKSSYKCSSTKNGEKLTRTSSGHMSDRDAEKEGIYINCYYQSEGNQSQKQVWCKPGEVATNEALLDDRTIMVKCSTPSTS